MTASIWSFEEGPSPLVAAAIHDGNKLREDLRPHIALSDKDRLREEDPFTALWTRVAPNRIVGTYSRFEVDLNRPRTHAVYRQPEDAWGLKVWKSNLPSDQVDRSLDEYDKFYTQVRGHLEKLSNQYGSFFVFDLHTYNHRRNGPGQPPANPEENPEVNIGTGTMDRTTWTPVVDHFIQNLRSFNFLGRTLDVRENVKFRGGHFSRWVHEAFPRSGCALAIEFKKFFMDEWTGELYHAQHEAILSALRSTVPDILVDLESLRSKQ